MIKRAKTPIAICISFIIGILIGFWTDVPKIIAFTIWSTVLLATLISVYYGRSTWQLRQINSWWMIMLFITSGILGASEQSIANKPYHFSHFFLPGDELMGTITEFNHGKGSMDKVIFDVTNVITDFSSRPVAGKLLAYIYKDSTRSFRVGDQLQFLPKLNKIQNSQNPGEFDQEKYWKHKGINTVTFLKQSEVSKIDFKLSSASFWNGIQSHLKSALQEALPERNYALATALSLGDKGDLSKETRDAFASAGAMHVLAVSGLHVGILLMILEFLFSKIPILRKRNRYLFVALLGVWTFALLTGASPSVVRAALMFSVIALGTLFGYPRLSLSSLLMSAVIMLVYNPNYLFDIGFQLSYLAMLGIIFFFDPISNVITMPKKWLQKVWDAVALGIAAQIMTLPITLYYFYQFPNYFILTNIGFFVLAGIALGSVLLFFAVHAIPFVSDVVAKIVEWIFEITILFVEFIEGLPLALATGLQIHFWQVLMAYLLIGFIWWYWNVMNWRNWKITAITIFIFAVFIQLNRRVAHFDEQLYVLNANIQTIVWKKGNELFCFYEYRATDVKDKVQFNVESLAKKLGGKITYFQLPDPNAANNALAVAHGKDELHLCSQKTYNQLSYKGNEFVFPTRYNFKLAHDKVVKGNWLKSKTINAQYDTTSGALDLLKL